MHRYGAVVDPEVQPILLLYDERFCIGFPLGHPLEQQNRVEIADVAGETYLRWINCE